MLIKVIRLEIGSTRQTGEGWKSFVQSETELHLNPLYVELVELEPVGMIGLAKIRLTFGYTVTVTVEDGLHIIYHINQSPGADAHSPTYKRLVDELVEGITKANLEWTKAMTTPAPVAPKTTSAKITAMTRDQTKNSGSPMWRCATEAGFMVNVFKHDDPLKDTFHVFSEAGYGGVMEAMNLGDTITWTRDPVAVELVQNGSFWNVAAVALRPDAAMPDEPEPDDEESDSAE